MLSIRLPGMSLIMCWIFIGDDLFSQKYNVVDVVFQSLEFKSQILWKKIVERVERMRKRFFWKNVFIHFFLFLRTFLKVTFALLSLEKYFSKNVIIWLENFSPQVSLAERSRKCAKDRLREPTAFPTWPEATQTETRSRCFFPEYETS